MSEYQVSRSSTPLSSIKAYSKEPKIYISTNHKLTSSNKVKSGNLNIISFTTKNNNSTPSRLRIRKLFSRKKERLKKPFILDGCNVNEEILPVYNGLSDRYLMDYFDKPRIKKHLMGIGIVL